MFVLQAPSHSLSPHHLGLYAFTSHMFSHRPTHKDLTFPPPIHPLRIPCAFIHKSLFSSSTASPIPAPKEEQKYLNHQTRRVQTDGNVVIIGNRETQTGILVLMIKRDTLGFRPDISMAKKGALSHRNATKRIRYPFKPTSMISPQTVPQPSNYLGPPSGLGPIICLLPPKAMPVPGPLPLPCLSPPAYPY
jgi:hypothetical protein